ncbi:hypothetical protein [Undibacterium sp. RTI2.1]|uniref:hypothetical protein n=1 Tax=Undibacterium sp. RTI2.1 TaxID=3048637 RepID=UPI002B224E84|nr:hypothetical protein [Undibacterium sp. RTI2.1]
MKAWVTRLWEDGKLIPKWRHSMVYPVLGELAFGECKNPLLRRRLHQANLYDVSHGSANQDLIPPLVDAAVIHMGAEFIILSGLELDVFGKASAQTWRAQLLFEKPSPKGISPQGASK